jgi:serine/threonine-protein kinase
MTALRTDVTAGGQAGSRPREPRRGKQLAIVLVLAGVLVTGAGIALAVRGSSPAPRFTASGTVTLGKDPKGDPKSIGKPCAAAPNGGYGDIRTGAQVVVAGSHGNTIAVGTLSSGVERGGPKAGYSCVFTFRIADVPPGEGFYGVSVGTRKAAQYAENVLSAQKVNLIYGG